MSGLLRVFSVLLCLMASPVLAGDPTYGFNPNDTEMNAAIREARSTLPVFYRKMDRTNLRDGQMLLKVAMPYGDDNNEHIWVTVAGRNGDRFDGHFSNAPVYINFRQYDPVSFTEDMVSDWMYFQGGKIHGSYTTRVILPQLPKDQQASLKAQLAPLP